MTTALERSRRVYQALDLPDHSPVEAVKKAYKELALRYHPDKNLDDPNATERFQEVNAAYSILSNPDRKSQYDASLWMGVGGSSPLSSAASGGVSSTFQRHSSLYEELSTFRAARRAASSNARHNTASKEPPKESQYTPEQTEFFRQRAKERERELYKKMEKEKEEARQRDLDKYKQAQEDRLREDERRRREQLASTTAALSSRAAKGKSPPMPATPLSAGGTTPSGRPSARCRSESPSAAAPSPGPSHDDGSIGRHRDRIERIRREKERQEEIRRAEQERFFDKKLQEARSKEERRHRQAEDEAREYYEKEQQLLVGQETAERAQLIEAEELMERRWIINASRRVESAYSFRVRQEHLEAVMLDARHHLADRWSKTISVLHLLQQEGAARIAVSTSSKSALEKLLLLHHLQRQVIRRNGVERMRMAQAMEISAEENVVALQRLHFGLLLVMFDEGRHRLTLKSRETHERSVFVRRCIDSVQGIVVGGALTQARRSVELEERASRAVLLLSGFEEPADRLRIANMEDKAFVMIIKMRGSAMCELLRKAMERGSEESERVQTSRRREQLDLSRMAVEIERLHEELHNAKEELELLRANAAAAIGDKSKQPTRMNIPPAMMRDVGTATAEFDPSMPAEGRSGMQLTFAEGGGGTNRELIALLCAENRRLSSSNGLLLEEMQRLQQNRSATAVKLATAAEKSAAEVQQHTTKTHLHPTAATGGGLGGNGVLLSPSQAQGNTGKGGGFLMSPGGERVGSTNGGGPPLLRVDSLDILNPNQQPHHGGLVASISSPSRSRAWGFPKPAH